MPSILARTTSPAPLLATVALLAAFALAGCAGLQGQATVQSATPLVSATGMAGLDGAVATNTKLAVTFNTLMDAGSLAAGGFTLRQGDQEVPGSVTLSGATAVFTPAEPLAPNTTYTATVSGAVDASGRAMERPYTWTFTTGAGADVTSPAVTASTVANASDGVAVNGDIVVTFSKDLDPSTVTAATFVVRQDGRTLQGTLSVVGPTVIFAPREDLAAGVTYDVEVRGAADLAGNALPSAFEWSFTTSGSGTASGSADLTPPTVVTASVVDVALGFDPTARLTVRFSEAMDPRTVNTATITLRHDGTPVAGTVSLSGSTATFKPATSLQADATYTLAANVGLRDLAGNALARGQEWTFTTSATLTGAAQAAVSLGSASGFAIVAATQVSSMGSSTVHGSLAVSPGTTVTGFGNVGPLGGVTRTVKATINGEMHLGDAAAASATADAGKAYYDAKGRAAGGVTIAGELGGRTLGPGLYQATSDLRITTGDLVLDARGDADAVFIFQVASALTVGQQVVLTGGATASNVFWQVGASATLEAGAEMQGTILAQQSVALGSGSTLTGRAVALTGSVTLDSASVVAATSASASRERPLVAVPAPSNAALAFVGATGLLVGLGLALLVSTARRA